MFRRVFIPELIGTALLLLVGLSIVILMFGEGSPMAAIIPRRTIRTSMSGA